MSPKSCGPDIMSEAGPAGSDKFVALEDLQLLAETTCWLAAWLVLPTWLGMAGASAGDFILYALGAGLLLSLGNAADRTRGLSDFRQVAASAALFSLSLLVVGGAVFGIAAVAS